MFSAAGVVVCRDSDGFDSRSLLSVEEKGKKRQKPVVVDSAAFSVAWNGKHVRRQDADGQGRKDPFPGEGKKDRGKRKCGGRRVRGQLGIP